MDVMLLIFVGIVNLVAGFFLGTWYCKNVKGMR